MLRAYTRLAGAILALAVSAISLPATATDAPRSPSYRAQAYRAELTRIAHSTWGLDAPVAVFAAQIHQESSWQPDALSMVGARGMAQFMPATATWWCQLARLAPMDCQPNNPTWAMRSLVGYDMWLLQRVNGLSEYDRMWASLRSYNGGLGHWQNEAKVVHPLVDRASVDRACGRASRAVVHCAENLGYPDRILNRLQHHYSGWGRMVVPE
jgi:soluble lytic murein transglycosylase-like protein